MNSTKIEIKELVKGKNTYPSWTTNSSYPLRTKDEGGNILVYYIIKRNRKISRLFPKEINLTPKLSYVLGLLKGEGSTSLGKSNYRRFTITNSDPKVINIILEGLNENSLFRKSNLIDKSVHLLHYIESQDMVVDYWSKKLGLPKNKFKCFDDKTKTSFFGVCHVYISDVLLRRIIDLIHDKFLEKDYS